MNIQLTPEQIKNLLVFLNRVQLQGGEAEALVQLKIILNKVLQNSLIGKLENQTSSSKKKVAENKENK